MSAGEEQEETAGGNPAAGGCVLVVLGGAASLGLWGIVSTTPEAAYFVVGIGACLGGQRARGWWQRRHPDGDGQDEPEGGGPDVGEALRDLSGADGSSVLLTALRDKTGVPDTKTVKTLLDTADIRWRTGVRTPEGNGPGVHADDIPPPPAVGEGAHSDGCCCRSGANANANNAASDLAQEGLRVDPIGQSGFVVRDPAETAHRRHTV